MAAPVAPVPDDSVSPTPRSKILARMRVGTPGDRDVPDSKLRVPRHVRAVGKLRVVFDRWSDRPEVECLQLRGRAQMDRALRIADRYMAKAPLASACADRAEFALAPAW